MGKKLEKIENVSTEVDTDDLQYTIRYDETNRGWLIYASLQRDMRVSMGAQKKDMVKDGYLSQSESDTFWELLNKIGEAMLIKRGFSGS